jgi:choline dehydrogenase-like flavoprotein
MITDFNRVGTGALQADVCIVGGGAAGISLALAFANTDHRVLLLESGGMQPEEETQNLYQSDVVGLPHHSIHDGRARVFGGTTTRWAGQALPLSDLDFRERAWVPYSGWPFGKEALAPYYRRAEQVMNLNHVSYDAESWPARLSRPQVQDDEHFSFSFSQFSATPNFATTYRRALERAQNVRVVLHANVTNIETDRQGTTVEGVEVRSLAGRAAVARARYYVICCGGIETARLLFGLQSGGAERGGEPARPRRALFSGASSHEGKSRAGGPAGVPAPVQHAAAGARPVFPQAGRVSRLAAATPDIECCRRCLLRARLGGGGRFCEAFGKSVAAGETFQPRACCSLEGRFSVW